jgi:NDP-sugar pyrophosphorylase family protein
MADGRTLDLIAGGRGSRLRSLLDWRHPGLPKHLLPIPGSEGGEDTLLTHAIEQALGVFDHIRVHVAAPDVPVFERYTAPYQGLVSLVIDHDMTGPLGPVARQLGSADARVFAFGGDAYCRFDWQDMIDRHSDHDLPVTALVAASPGTTAGARVKVRRGGPGCTPVMSWERAPELDAGDLINIGGYIFDAVAPVRAVFAAAERHSEDAILGELASHGLLAAYVPDEPGFNVNTPETYRQLWGYLAPSP